MRRVGADMSGGVLLCVSCAVPQVTDVDWRVDYVLASSALAVSQQHSHCWLLCQF